VSSGTPRRRVGILFGGPSAEHDVSCVSAMALLRALPAERYEATAIGITADARFVLPAVDLDAPVVDTGSAMDDHLVAAGRAVALVPGHDPSTAAVVGLDGTGEVLAELDVVFPLLHGPFGEDGVVQGLLEAVGVPYVGSGVHGSAVGMDKVSMKRAFAAEGLPIPPYRSIREADWLAKPDVDALTEGLAYPLFVKPANMGSSIGISRVTTADGIAEAMALAFVHDDRVLVEQGVDHAREIECGVLGGPEPMSSPPGEVRVAGDWFDYQLKYFSPGDPMIVPAQLPEAIDARLRELAVQAFQAVGADGLARVDFLYDDEAEQVYVNEINTMPGFTAHSMFPKVWAADGIPYHELAGRLLDLAFERHARRRRLVDPA